jgi:AcrR family transcriptional regulator
MSTSQMQPAVQPKAKERILKTAGRLFYDHGYRAIGIDRIIAEADVAKASFYNHFSSKDELIVAWIGQAEHFGLAMEEASIAGRADPLMALMEAVIARARETSCRGCTFQVSAAEFADPDHPAHVSARRVKDATILRYISYARAQGLSEPERVARQIFLLIEGIWASVRIYGLDAPIDDALAAARRIIAA